MNQLSSPQHELKHFGLRFTSNQTENRYSDWRTEETLPFIRFGFMIAFGNWTIFPVFLYMVDPQQALLVTQFICIVMMPTIFISIAVTFARKLRWLVAYTGAANIVIAGIFLDWVVHEQMTFPPGVASLPYVSGGTVIMVLFAFTIFRLPIRLAFLSAIPVIALSVYYGASDQAAGVITKFELYGNITTILIGTFSGALIGLILEFVTRRSFVQQEMIAAQTQLIRRYIPPAVADHISEGKSAQIDSPQRRRITILFSDIVGFTDMADRLDAESLTQVINEYMAAMADIVEAHGGTLNEFSGDGLMAVFGAPNDMEPENQVLSAVKAAQAMQARLPALNQSWLKLGIGEPMKIRIGINTGVLSVGSFGSEGRMTYTAIGLQTNIAARIQSHCEPGGILLSDASWHLVKDQIDCEPRGEVECKGVHFPVKVYAPGHATEDL